MQNTHSEAEDWSQEIRFASNDNAFWNYTAGMFWEDFDGLTNNYTDLGGPFAMYGSMAGIRNGDMVQHLQIPNGRETLAFFLHNRFELSAATNLQLGIRWQEIDGEQIVRAAVIDNYAPPAESGPVTNPLLAGALNPRLTSAGVWNIFKGNIRTGDLIPNELQTTEEREWTGGVKLSHYLNDDDMVYASLDRSFRPSGATITPTALSADSLLFDSETSDSLELGYKAMAFDGNLRCSAAAYYQQ
ncbi:MAG: TonB-dependent receptor [Gammaproteobacteria bacterium]|nr:TonB-dependent receptor [Gammaproteobacteria bacterium]